MPVFSKVSIIVATLNSAKVLELCLKSIRNQNYPHKLIEILIVDGGSTDDTLTIAKKYRTKIITNPLKTAEAAKALGLKKATGKYIALIDSDNILPSPNWLKKMLIPFHDPKIIGSEPISFTYRPRAGFIERYSALIGANDPFAYVNGNYDRYSYLSNKWTELIIPTLDKKYYLEIKIDNYQNIPTIGANGTIFRNDFLQKYITGDYLYDIDVLVKAPKPLYFAKVRTGIIHSFCESNISKFIKKQDRRLRDFYYHQDERSYQWSYSNKILLFSFYSLLIVPAFIDSLRGYIKKNDIAWFFHPLACFITWWIYFLDTIAYKSKLIGPPSRNKWQQ